MVTESQQLVTNGAGLSRKIGLDLLRVYAVLSVVYGHGWHIAQNITQSKLYLSIKFDNITMFFVMTGFLICLKLLKNLDADQIRLSTIKDFWVQRLIRTYPLYFCLLSIVGVEYYLTNKTFPIMYAHYFGYMQNVNTPHPDFYPELWSLAVQEWFYFIFPLILLGISFCKVKDKKNLILLSMIVFIFITTLIRISKINEQNYFDIYYWDLNLRKQVSTRLDSMFYGGLMAYMLLNHVNFFKKYTNHFLCVGVILLILNKILFAENWFYTNYIYLSVTSVGAALLLPFFYGLKFNLKVINKTITQISSISYAIYLLHLSPVMILLVPYAMNFLGKSFPAVHENTHMISYVAYWLLTLSLAIVMHRLVADPASKFLLNKYAGYKSLQTANSLPLGSIK